MAKYHVMLNRDVVTTIGHLVVMGLVEGQKTVIAPPTSFVQTAGARVFRTLKAAKAFINAQRADHGHDVCSDVYLDIDCLC